MRPFHTYLLRCADGSYYAGHTDDLDARLLQHQTADTGYLVQRRPFELAWQGEFESREGALAFELQIKGWSRAKKEALIRGDWEGIRALAVNSAERLRQAQPERVGEDPGLAAAPPTVPPTVRPELVEGASTTPGDHLSPLLPVDAEARLRQAQPERAGEGAGLAAAPPAVPPAAPATVQPAAPPAVQPAAPPAVQPAAPPTVQPAAPPTVQPELVEGLLHPATPSIRRRAIAKAITLIESTRQDHREQADALLTALLPHSGQAFRLGISGVPGVGKSTFIEGLGLHLIGAGHRVAVLTIDPSSSVSGGSILGDKTRMEKLSVDERAYIRPSPSSGTLGGVAEKTREAMLVCEAAGHDVVIVETVGVGQSEIAVAGMTDMFVLMQLPNAGDDLQAIKKGVMELADLVVVNKADIDADAARRAQAQITSSLRLLGLHGPQEDAGLGAAWQPRVLPLSALLGSGIEDFWQTVAEFRKQQAASGRLDHRRRQQALAWMWERIDAGLKQAFQRQPQVRALLPRLTREVLDGLMPASTAARTLLASAGGTNPI